jgi:hypothetical protein
LILDGRKILKGLLMQNGFLLILLTLSLNTQSVFSCDLHGKAGIVPENNRYIPATELTGNGMTQEKFNSIIAKVAKVYIPVCKQKGGHLQILGDWNDGTVNAYAKRTAFSWQVKMFGGLARHPLVTEDGFALVICHELGHHIGGRPSSTWASVEGQSDYYGTMKCLRRILEKDDNQTIMSKVSIDAEATEKCQQVYHNQNEIALCQRIAMAGKSLALMLGDLGGSTKISFNTPDKNQVTSTMTEHPAPQCRLDTYFQGILCDKSWDQDVSNDNTGTGTCTGRDGNILGKRPLCWYKPTTPGEE